MPTFFVFLCLGLSAIHRFLASQQPEQYLTRAFRSPPHLVHENIKGTGHFLKFCQKVVGIYIWKQCSFRPESGFKKTAGLVTISAMPTNYTV